MTPRPEVVDFATVTMIVGAAGSSVARLDTPCTEGCHHVDDDPRGVLVLEKIRKRVHSSCSGTVSHHSTSRLQLSNIASSLPYPTVTPSICEAAASSSSVSPLSIRRTAYENTRGPVCPATGRLGRGVHDLSCLLENRREISVSHNSMETEMRLRPSAGADRLN